MQHQSYEIVFGLPASVRQQAAELYLEAFAQKFLPILKPREKAEALLAEGMRPAKAVGAISGERLLGLAGFVDPEGGLFAPRLRDFTRLYGLFGALWRITAMSLFERKRQAGELLMEGIVVHPDARGMGIGTALLDAIERVARERGLSQIRLDVVDTNPGAKRLYARRGFVAVKEEKTPYLRSLFGFSASTTMLKYLPATG